MFPKLTYRTRLYLRGLFAATLNGISNSIVMIIVDPMDFNIFQGGLNKLLPVMVASGIFSFFTYIKEHPLPNLDKDSDYYEVRSKQISEIKDTGNGTQKSERP